MRTFNENIPCQSSLTIGETSYKLKKLSAKEGNGFVFIEEMTDRIDSFHITSATLKALYLLITTNEEKK